MENELLKVFDENRNEIGVATREEVHRVGHWHETFHCWFISRENDKDYIYLQIRSDSKKDYPGLLDITAAGHLLVNETVNDGIREVEEELGIALTFKELISLGIIDYSIKNGELLDNEFAHVFLHKSEHSFGNYKLQQEEVSGIVRTEFNQFVGLWLGNLEEIQIEGFEVDGVGNNITISKIATKNDFVPHDNLYYKGIICQIEKNLIFSH